MSCEARVLPNSSHPVEHGETLQDAIGTGASPCGYDCQKIWW